MFNIFLMVKAAMPWWNHRPAPKHSYVSVIK